MTNWQHWAPNEYVTGIEPGTHPPMGQKKARQENSLIFLQPGQTKIYDVKFQIHHTKDDIATFLNSF
jgi:hypothetical protein